MSAIRVTITAYAQGSIADDLGLEDDVRKRRAVLGAAQARAAVGLPQVAVVAPVNPAAGRDGDPESSLSLKEMETRLREATASARAAQAEAEAAKGDSQS